MAANLTSPSLRFWVHEDVDIPWARFGGTTTGNILQYFLGTPDVTTNVSYSN